MKLTLPFAFALSGCFTTIGPVITDAHMDQGALRTTRCDLVIAPPWAIGFNHFDACRDETGKPVKATPTSESNK